MKKFLLLPLTGALVISGCADPNFQISNHQRAAIGTAVGAVAGGVLGHQVDDEKGRYVGAVAGALAGAAIGHYMDNQQQQLQQAMAGSGVQVNRVDEGTIQLNIQSEILFDVDRADIKQSFYPTLTSLAQTLQQYPQTVVHVYGFTDGSGSDAHNLQLSQRRAQSAAQFLMGQGVASNRFVIQGYGERFATAQNNPQDRRVSIFLKAIDQNNPNAAYQPVY